MDDDDNCPECGEEIPAEAMEEADEKYGGQLVCPSCGYFFD